MLEKSTNTRESAMNADKKLPHRLGKSILLLDHSMHRKTHSFTHAFAGSTSGTGKLWFLSSQRLSGNIRRHHSLSQLRLVMASSG